METNIGYEDCHCFALRRGARHLTRTYDSVLAPSGLSISQFTLLVVLSGNAKINMAELGRIMVMERTTLLRALKPLIDDGLVASEVLKGQRSHGYSLTPRGFEQKSIAEPLWLKAQAEFENSFGLKRAARLRQDNLDVSANQYLP